MSISSIGKTFGREVTGFLHFVDSEIKKNQAPPISGHAAKFNIKLHESDAKPLKSAAERLMEEELLLQSSSNGQGHAVV